MPILNNPIDVRYEGRTQTQLVVSEGNAPAEKWLPSAATNALVQFNYAFGPENNPEVVIPKGKIVAPAGVEYDVNTEKYIPRLKIANATDIPMGVNHHNVYQTKRDRFSGNAPTVITREYIRVPLFIDDTRDTAIAAAAAIKFGAMWLDADPTDKAAIANAAYGQYVVSDANGNFAIPAVLATSFAAGQVVGQVMGIELDIPPAGYLQYFTEMTDSALNELIKASREVPSAGRLVGSDLNLDTFPTGSTYLNSKEDLAYILKNFRSGIPFLTDGYFKARTTKVMATLADAEVLDIRHTVNVAVDAVTKAITITDPIGAMIFVKLKDKLDAAYLQTGDSVTNHPEMNGVASVLSVTIGGVALSASNYHVDYDNNMVVIYPVAVAAAADVAITATMLVNQIPGIPTGWDFSGCFGEARILLMK